MTEIHVRYIPRDILACIFLEFSFTMTYFVIPIRYTESTNCYIGFLMTERGMNMSWKDKWKNAWNELGNISLRDFFTFTKKEKWFYAISVAIFLVGMGFSMRGIETITSPPGWVVGYVHEGGLPIPDYVSYTPQKTFEDKGDVQVVTGHHLRMRHLIWYFWWVEENNDFTITFDKRVPKAEYYDHRTEQTYTLSFDTSEGTDSEVNEKLNVINDASEEFFKKPFIKVDRIQRVRENYLFTPKSETSSVTPATGPLFVRGSVKKSV